MQPATELTLIINISDQQVESQRSANRQSFQQRPTQQTSANPKALSSVPGPVSAQINSMYGSPHPQPLLQGHGGGSTSSSCSSNNRSLNELQGGSEMFLTCICATLSFWFKCLLYVCNKHIYSLSKKLTSKTC